MIMAIHEWDKANNVEKNNVAVWGDTPNYPEHIREIVREIQENGYAERGDVIYTEEEEDA